MRPRRMSEVAEAVGGRLEGADALVDHVTIDSRQVRPRALFVALAGERTDGARFVDDAFARGAAGALVPERAPATASGPCVRVASTGEALLRLAADERARSEAVVVGITGANGKTSTKDLAAAVSSRRFATHASPASFNNEIGVPLTLLGAPPATEVIVAELGARHVGDAALLCTVARPRIVVVTNVGVAHLEVFGSWEAIVEASAEPVEALGPDGVAVLNADDPVVIGYASRTRGRVRTFGRSAEADVRGQDVVLDDQGVASFELLACGERTRVRLAVPGEHMVANALAAAAVGVELGVPLASIADALAVARIARWRMEVFTTAQGLRVLNDAYNANPESVAAALRTARWIARDGRLIAVLGRMAELGPISDEAHEDVGALAARLGVETLVVVGEDARAIAAAAEREGLGPDDVVLVNDVETAARVVRDRARPGDVVLCKASRVVGLERVAEALR
ncbi:MAG: UDP-N-acetylmuramoyl-tripeptide--D-alanyl-D-alanine ligase [Actinomycetota bacterium]|nr:MAG: UDP-N-acetylmuramoyl-tripeptide--D-alanyl-D-alanine ligase [Actinomycetota bacterium]